MIEKAAETDKEDYFNSRASCSAHWAARRRKFHRDWKLSGTSRDLCHSNLIICGIFFLV